MDGYAQDGVFGAVAGAINAVNPFAHVGISLANTVDEAEKGNYKAAGEHGYRAAVGIVGIFVAAVGVGAAKGGGGNRGTSKAHDHHVMTNKNYVSTARGGPWSPVFEDMARKAGMKLNEVENRVRVPGHRGPHPRAYHEEVFKRLQHATDGLSGDAYSNAFREQLAKIRTDAATPGSQLNRLITKD